MSYVLRAVIKNKLVLDSFLGGLFRKAAMCKASVWSKRSSNMEGF